MKNNFRKRKFLFLIQLFLFFSYNSFAQSTPSEQGQIRILTFNILHGATMKGDMDLNLIARTILKTNPDLVALQEVDFKTTRVEGKDLVLELAYLTGMVPVFGKAMDYDGGEYGEAILSRFSFISTRTHALDASDGYEPRAALEVVVKLESGDTISFIGTHLDHTVDPGNRVSQANQINSLLNGIKYPVILAGDLNSLPGSEPMKILRSKWQLSDPSGLIPTYPSSSPTKKIDYVLYYPFDAWVPVETHVIDDKIASDHCPYLVILNLKHKTIE